MKDQGRWTNLSMGIAIGSSLGVAFGIALDNIALGIAFGVAIGALIGSALPPIGEDYNSNSDVQRESGTKSDGSGDETDSR